MSKTKFIGVSIIVGGAALAGAIAGWELGMCRFEMSRDQLAMVGAGCGAILAVVGCASAIERSEARAQSRALMQRFERILFRNKELPSGAQCESGANNTDINVAPRSGQLAMSPCVDTGSGTCR